MIYVVLDDVIGAAWSSKIASLLRLAEVCSGAMLSGRTFIRCVLGDY